MFFKGGTSSSLLYVWMGPSGPAPRYGPNCRWDHKPDYVSEWLGGWALVTGFWYGNKTLRDYAPWSRALRPALVLPGPPGRARLDVAFG